MWVAIAGCSYHPGSFRDREGPWSGTRVSSGCLDLAVSSTEVIDGSPVIAYSVGNRCDHKIDIDLGRLHVVARDSHGVATPLVAFDPRGELGPTELNALWSGHAQIAYRGAPVQSTAICVAVDDTYGDAASSRLVDERWVCIAKDRV